MQWLRLYQKEGPVKYPREQTEWCSLAHSRAHALRGLAKRSRLAKRRSKHVTVTRGNDKAHAKSSKFSKFSPFQSQFAHHFKFIAVSKIQLRAALVLRWLGMDFSMSWIRPLAWRSIMRQCLGQVRRRNWMQMQVLRTHERKLGPYFARHYLCSFRHNDITCTTTHAHRERNTKTCEKDLQPTHTHTHTHTTHEST